MKTNNRRNVRVYCGAPARAEGPRGPLKGVCRNISLGGMFFAGGTLPVGKQFDFMVDLPVGTVTGTGEVRYHHTYEEGEGMGVRFTRIAQDDLFRIQKFVAQADAA